MEVDAVRENAHGFPSLRKYLLSKIPGLSFARLVLIMEFTLHWAISSSYCRIRSPLLHGSERAVNDKRNGLNKYPILDSEL